MSATPTYGERPGGVGRAIRYLTGMLLICAAVATDGAEVLFPQPLHLTREIADPISGSKTTVEEYCHGNRIVSISGNRTAIVDHEKGTAMLIDFAAGTWSSASFEEIAKVRSQRRPAVAVRQGAAWKVLPPRPHAIGARLADVTEARHEGAAGLQVMTVAGDREIRLSRRAVEALLGTGYPNPPDTSGAVLVDSLRARERRTISAGTGSGAGSEVYALPLEQTARFEVGGEVAETRSIVLRVGSALPPADRLAIPPGASRVEWPEIAAQRLLEELDHPSGPNLR